MSKCPVCDRTGLIGKEREIVGAKAVTVYKCHGCDNEWRVVDQPAQAPPPFAAHKQSAPRGPASVSSRAISPTTPSILILSVGRAEAYQPHRTEVCISITDPKASPARLSPKFKAVLRLSFTDISAPTEHPSHVRFGAEHAQAILDLSTSGATSIASSFTASPVSAGRPRWDWRSPSCEAGRFKG